MDSATSVSLADLRVALNRVLDAIQHDRGEHVELDADFYYVLPSTSVYDVGTTPSGADCTLGSLVDDIELVRELVVSPPEDEDGRAVCVWHDLAHLVGILQCLAAMDLPGPAETPH